MAACFILSAASRGTTETFAVFLLPLSAEFGWERAGAASIYGVFMLCFGLGGVLAGRVFDVLGPGRTYVIGLLALGIGMWLTARLDSLWQFYATLGIMVGVGSSMIGPVPHAALLSRWFRGNLTIAIALVSAASGLGVLVLAPVAQILVDAIGWRGAYEWLGLGTLALIATVAFLPWRRIGMGRAEPAPVTGPARPADGIAFRDARRMRAFWALFGIQFFTSVSMFAINPQIVAYLVEQGFPALTAASAFGLAGVAGTVGLIVFGVLADRVGRMVAITLSYGMSLAGFVILGFVGLSPELWLVYLFVAVYGPTFGSRGPIVNAMVARIFGRGRDLGTIIGAVHLGMGSGAAVGATAGGLIHDLTGGYEAVLAFAFLFSALPLAMFWAVPELRRA